MKSRNINGKKVTLHPDIILYEPRYIERKPSPPLRRFSMFSERESPYYLDEQLSHAIYDIEIANSNAMKGKR